MSDKTIGKLLTTKNMKEAAAGTGLLEARLKQIKGGDTITALEAVALAKHFDVDAKVLLSQQADAQLAQLKYKAPKSTVTTTTAASGMSSTQGRRGSNASLF